MDIGGWPLVNESSQNRKNGYFFKIWTAVHRVISFRDDSFTRGHSNVQQFIYEKSATNIRDWSLRILSYTLRGYSLNLKNFDIYNFNEEVSHSKCHLSHSGSCTRSPYFSHLRTSTQITSKVRKYSLASKRDVQITECEIN